jgi:putative redox protein
MTIELRRDLTARWPSRCRSAAMPSPPTSARPRAAPTAGPSPHDLYDAALGACKALTVMWYARKKGIPVDDIQTRIERDDSQERSGVYKLTAKLQVKGDLTDAQLQELHAVAQKCPVHKLMTAVTTEITTELERLP